MNTHDKFDLPPLPYPQIPGNDYTVSDMKDYATAAIEPYAKRIAELEAARIAYASEFPPNEDGDPDVGSIHENIRKLKADRKRRGEPVNTDLVRKWQAENGVEQRPDSREARMVVIRHDDDGKPTVWCDPEIADLVRALNDGGLATVGSCSGHGWRPGNIMLADGRVLVVCKDADEAREVESHFPGINGEPPLAAEPVKWEPGIDDIMSKVQEFASTWAMVDSRFDDGTAYERAEECKSEIRDLIARRQGAQPQPSGNAPWPVEEQPDGSVTTVDPEDMKPSWNAEAAFVDAMKFGMGIMTGGQHVPVAEIYKPSGNAGELDERAAFEKALRRRVPNVMLHRVDMAGSSRIGEYCREEIEASWRLWNDRAALAAQGSGQDREDAERYRSMRASAANNDERFVDELQRYGEENFADFKRPTEDEFDAAVDAARAAAKGEV